MQVENNLGDVINWLSNSDSFGLPYSQSNLQLMQQHTVDMLQEFPGLKGSIVPTTDSAGRPCRLLKLHGVLPMFHLGAKYNVPVGLWLVEDYPQVAPAVFVEPTADMEINPRHPCVNAVSGQVTSPYLQKWDPAMSNLLDLGADTSIQFADRPPLFATAAHPVPPVNQQRPGQSPVLLPPPNGRRAPTLDGRMGHRQEDEDDLSELLRSNPMMRNGATGGTPSSCSGGRGSGLEGNLLAIDSSHRQQQQQNWQRNSPPAPPPPPPPPDSQSTSQARSALIDKFRSAAVKHLTGRLQGTLAANSRDDASDVESLLRTQGQLQSNAHKLQQAVDDLARERAALECSVVEMSHIGQAIDSWLVVNEAKQPLGTFDAAEALAPSDALCAQALEAQADDMAVEDTMYVVERAFQSGSMDVATYVRKVRLLCSKQFYSRVVCMKVAQAQHHNKPPLLPPSQQHWSHQQHQQQQQQQQHQQHQHQQNDRHRQYPSQSLGSAAIDSTSSVGSAGGSGGWEHVRWPAESARVVEIQVGDSWTGVAATNPMQPPRG